MNDFIIREATIHDRDQIFQLYQRVSKHTGGLARAYEEITPDYIENFSTQAAKTGLQFVIQNPEDNTLLGEVHCYKLVPKVFHHVLSDLTIAVDPALQGKGWGRKLFQALLTKVETERKDILRVELIAKESNAKAIQFYQSLGFQIEGRLVNRIFSTSQNKFEADIPMGWMNEKFERK